MIERSYSPKTVATALGVSESSLKRWCDCGKIEVTKTMGGHRRIPREAVLSFVRENRFELAQPELLGLSQSTRFKQMTVEMAQSELVRRLVDGDELACRQLLIELYLSGHRISQIGDEVISPAFREIGERWECASLEVYQERLSCEICSRALGELRRVMKRPGKSAPLAIGSTPQQDPYSLPTTLLEMVMSQNGYQAVSLGTRIPWNSLQAAVEKLNPTLLWLSVSHLDDVESFIAGYQKLHAAVGHQLPLIIGGRALSAEIRHRLQFALFCDRLSHLDSFLQSFQPNRIRAAADSK